ncbi:hypothetical protein BLOT_001353 [Blomia tropicalis]|nr:hypothetical protein BLOT_001353 [Blomia tropicalis]
MLKPNSGESSSLYFAYCIPQFVRKSFVNTKPILGLAATDRRITAGSSQSMEMDQRSNSDYHNSANPILMPID